MADGHRDHAVDAECNPNRPSDGLNYYAGWQRAPGYDLGGMYAQIFNYNAYQSSVSFSTQYVKLKKEAASNLEASIGWREWQVNSRFTWADYRISPNHNLSFAIGPYQNANSYSYYTVLHNRQNPGTLTFQLNGTTFKTVSNVVQWVPRYSNAYGQIGTLANQMPGGYSNLSTFHDTTLWYNGSWQPFAGSTYSSDPQKFGAIADGYKGASIWDYACPF